MLADLGVVLLLIPAFALLAIGSLILVTMLGIAVLSPGSADL